MEGNQQVTDTPQPQTEAQQPEQPAPQQTEAQHSEQATPQQPEPITPQPDQSIPQQVEVKYPFGIEGIDYNTYTGSKTAMIVRHEVTYGDILVSTLLAFLIIIILIRFFHGLLLGGKK